MSIKPNLLEDNEKGLFNTPFLSQKDKFTQPRSELIAKKERVLALEDLSIFESKRLNKQNFTNFLNHNTKYTCELTLADLISDLKNAEFNKVKFELDENLDDMPFSQRHKICDILNLYTNVQLADLPSINKAKIKDNANRSTSFRIYLKLTDETYKIILLDPLHLAIPSKVQYQKGYRFDDFKANNLCMRQHIILKNFELTKIYKEIKKLFEIVSYP